MSTKIDEQEIFRRRRDDVLNERARIKAEIEELSKKLARMDSTLAAYETIIREEMPTLFIDIQDSENTNLIKAMQYEKINLAKRYRNEEAHSGEYSGESLPTYRELFIKILENADRAMSAREIWDAAAALGAQSGSPKPERVADITLRKIIERNGPIWMPSPGRFASIRTVHIEDLPTVQKINAEALSSDLAKAKAALLASNGVVEQSSK